MSVALRGCGRVSVCSLGGLVDGSLELVEACLRRRACRSRVLAEQCLSSVGVVRWTVRSVLAVVCLLGVWLAVAGDVVVGECGSLKLVECDSNPDILYSAR